MRSLTAFLCLALLQACAEQPDRPPEDCETARAQFPACFDRHHAGGGAEGFEAMWYACIPHSAPQEIAGSWSTDFEWSAFFEGQEPTLEEAFWVDYRGPELAFKHGVEPPPKADGKARVWHIEFIGRRPTCQIHPDIRPTIFVEEIRRRKLLREVPGYPHDLPTDPER